MYNPFKKRTCSCGGDHDFQPRYEEREPFWLTSRGELEFSGSLEQLRSMYEKRYVCDVCRWCGKVVKREES
jgi:hypothetical protein